MNPIEMQKIFQQQSIQDEVIQKQTLQVIGFQIGEECFAIPILDIQEIIKPVPYTHIPFVPEYILGVFHLRGNILPLIDLRQKLGLKHKKIDEETCILVIHHQDQKLGIMIEKLTESILLDEEEIDTSITQEDIHLYGVGKQEDKLIAILNTQALFKRDF